jgi:hypothetical protein
MKVAGGLLITLLGSTVFTVTASSQDKSTQPQCTGAAVSFSLKAGDSFQQRINDLTFKVKPVESTGWFFSLEDAKGHDFLYPVNPPLRLNGSQTLGAGYGATAKQSLAYGRELRFVLSEADYAALWPYVEHALWPYSAPDPEKAADQYLSELDKLRTGLVSLAIIRSDVSENDQVRSAEFHAEFIAQTTFEFVPSLSPHAVVCPGASLTLNEQLPARIPPPNPDKYRHVRDASNWNNPYLLITSEGFYLRFQGGQMRGPLSILARTVVGLPDSAWPYGRVLAASESGVQSTESSKLTKTNKEEADKILKELGLIVDWWPTA